MTEMTELQEEINNVYTAIAVIPVSGDHVEVMAAAREHLRRAYKLAASELKEAEHSG